MLLDSLVDWPHDVEAGHHSLVEPLPSPQETAEGLDAIARTALSSTQALPTCAQHPLLLVAMAGLYLSKPEAAFPTPPRRPSDWLPRLAISPGLCCSFIGHDGGSAHRLEPELNTGNIAGDFR